MKIEMDITGSMQTYLEILLKTGLYGHTLSDVAERLVTRGILEEIGKRIPPIEPKK